MWYRMMLVLAACTLAFSFSAVPEETPRGGGGQRGACEQFEPAEDGRCIHGARDGRGGGRGTGEGLQGRGVNRRGQGQGNPAGRGLGVGGGAGQGGRR